MTNNLQRTPPVARPYRDESDLIQMQQLLMESRRQTDDWRYWHVGELMWGFFMLLCHLNPADQLRLWHDDDRLVGYALLGEDPWFDFQVLPDYAWSGIESDALAWAEERLAELCPRDLQVWGGSLICAARQDDGRRLAFLEQHGFPLSVEERAEVNLLRRLDEPIPEPNRPEGCRIRAVAGASDVPDRAAVQREVWLPWTVGVVSDEDYIRLMELPGYHQDLDLVALAADGAIAAYVTGWIDPINRIGDLGPVGARPAYRRQGFTRAVLLEALRRMQALGMDRVCVSTGETNTPALQLYRSIGFRPANRTVEHLRTR